MKPLKILVMCPGSWTHGLNSPERGEGRWAQNYVRLLKKAGHDVIAASGGFNAGISEGVPLIAEHEAHRHGPFDLYIDSAWWNGKVPTAKAEKYITLKWSLENYLAEGELPDNLYIGCPYSTHFNRFMAPRNPHQNKTFMMPTMFCETMKEPNVSSQAVFIPGKVDKNRPYKKFLHTMIEAMSPYSMRGAYFEEITDVYPDIKNDPKNFFAPKLPYNEIMDIMASCRVNVPVLSPACTIEATVNGLATIFWNHGEFFKSLSDYLGIGINTEDDPAKFVEIFERLMKDDKFFKEVVWISQDYFKAYTYEGAIKYFNHFVECVF